MPSPVPARAPALYVTGYAARSTGASPLADATAAVPAVPAAPVPVAFRLPLPPTWEGPVEGVRAAERRARRAYFAALDAMQCGRGASEQAAQWIGKLQRFAAELRAETARAPLLHLVGIWRTVGAAPGGAPVLPPPPAVPLTAVVVHVPPPPAAGRGGPAALEARYAWALAWLHTRAYVAAPRELRLEWRVIRPA